MRNLTNKVYYILCIVLFAVLSSCGDMDETYRHFWEDGERVYPAPADSLKTYTGRNRIGVSWKIFGDPNVNKAKLYWNNRTDSLEVPFQSNGGEDSVFVIVDNLDEGSYSFEVFTYDHKGNRSILRSSIGNVYGDTYIRTLLPRFLHSASYKNDILTMVWGNMADVSSIGNEISYKNIKGTESMITVNNNVDTTFIHDYDYDSEPTITYRTIYLPPMSIDTFYTNVQTVVVKGAPTYFSKNGWTATASSFDSRAGSSYRPPEHTIDGKISTIWVNQISPQELFPHTLTIDMGEIKNDVAGISLIVQRRNETPKLIDILVSDNGEDWILMGEFIVENLADVVQNFDFFDSQKIRYFRIVAKEPWGSTNNVVIAEVEAYTYNR